MYRHSCIVTMLCLVSLAAPTHPANLVVTGFPSYRPNRPSAASPPPPPPSRLLKIDTALRLRGGSSHSSSSMEDEESSEHAPGADAEAARAADYAAKPGAWYVQKLGNENHEFRLRPEADARAYNLTSAIAAAGAGEGSKSIFVSRGVHNATDADGDIEPLRELHFEGSAGGGSVIAGYGEPLRLKIGAPGHPERGWGRFSVRECATGTSFTNIRWESVNLHCIISHRSAVLFQNCSLQTEAFHYCSAVWGTDSSFLAFKACNIGGYSQTRQATNGVVLDSSTAVLDGCNVSMVWGSAAVVSMNSTVRIQRSNISYCHAVVAADDGTLHDEDEALLPGTVELVNNSIMCFQGWRDNDRTVNFVEEGNEYEDMDFPELEGHLDQFKEPQAKKVWDEDLKMFVHCGMTDEELAKEKKFFDSMRRPNEANVDAINRELRREHRRPWESSTSEEEEGQGGDAGEIVPKNPKKEVNPLRPEMPRNIHKHGVQKGPRVLKNRRNEYAYG